MKKLVLFKGSLFLTIGLFLITYNSYGQDKKLARLEHKEARRAELLANFQVLDTLLEGKAFVLKADFLQNQYGDRIDVTPVLNFIRVDSTDAVLQTGSNYRYGYNGVGGVTAEGRISSWKLIKDIRNLSFNIRFSIITNIGVYDVFMTLNADNNARATITGLRRGMLTYDGHLELISNSAVFKGQNRY